MPVINTEHREEIVVFITILESDRKWINETKGGMNREERLHQVLENYRRAGLDTQYAEVKV